MSTTRLAATGVLAGAVLSAAVAVSACSGDPEPGAQATPALPTTAPAPTGGTTGAVPPTPPPASTQANSRTSPVSSPTAGGHVGGDIDGDGTPDEVVVVDAAGAWEIAVTGTSDGELQVLLPDEAGLLGDPSVAGSSDLDGDGFGEVWVRSSVGGDATMSWVVRYDGERLGPVTRPDAGDSPVVEGSSVANELVVWCDGPVLWWADVTRGDADGSPASVLRISYQMDGFTWRELDLDQRDSVPLDDVEELVGGPGCTVSLP